eukprot:TRINITY_DN1248_c0_g1_i3.p1 TRINITY_DN1248_c0_g1~~TRINITY_DN1248_c0_g1_i3.p1  ORF type:complete len:812 (+),score=183.53 TRINITY_DN1248_c0_g1_i3:80-2437(+)
MAGEGAASGQAEGRFAAAVVCAEGGSLQLAVATADALAAACAAARGQWGARCYVAALSPAATSDPLLRQACGAAGRAASMVTNSPQHLAAAAALVAAEALGGGSYSCAACGAKRLTLEQIQRHVPLWHSGDPTLQKSQCPVCAHECNPMPAHLQEWHRPKPAAPPPQVPQPGGVQAPKRSGPVCSLVICRHQGRYLFVQETGGRGFWVPGGAVDPGESLVEAAERETVEECGIQIRVVGVLGVESHRPRQNFRRATLLAEPLDPEQALSVKTLPDFESGGACWIATKQLPSLFLRFGGRGEGVLGHPTLRWLTRLDQGLAAPPLRLPADCSIDDVPLLPGGPAPAASSSPSPAPAAAAARAPEGPPAPRTPPRRRRAQAMPVCFDMETGDPDDVATLLLLAAHPDVHLRCVTVTPGTGEQVALLRWLLREVGMLDTVQVGARDWPGHEREHAPIKGAFYSRFGRLPAPPGSGAVRPAADVLAHCCGADVTLLTGAPLHNVAAALERHPGARFGRWVAQGGFAGEGVVPSELQLPKFRGKVTCPTWNFGGAPAAAAACLASRAIARKVLVAKNCCHDPRAAYTAELDARIAAAAASCGGRGAAALRLLREAMARRDSGGKAPKQLHDPLAMAVAVDEGVAALAEVECYRSGGEWGSRLSPGSGVWIATAFHPARFHAAIVPLPPGEQPGAAECSGGVAEGAPPPAVSSARPGGEAGYHSADRRGGGGGRGCGSGGAAKWGRGAAGETAGADGRDDHGGEAQPMDVDGPGEDEKRRKRKDRGGARLQ